MKFIVAGLLVLVPLGACGASDEADASAQLACRHFRNVSRDYSDGLLSMSELRDKLEEVHDDGRFSEEPGFATATRTLLDAANAMDTEAMTDAVLRLGDVCDNLDL